MSKAHPPELKKFMDKKISLRINGSRQVEGILCGFDPFMNLVLDDATEFNKDGTAKGKIGKIINQICLMTGVSGSNRGIISGQIVVRGNSVVMLEARDRI